MNQISTNERNDLQRLEGVVRRGKKAFLEVGAALKEIRDRKLYKATHGTFADYVEEKFEIKRHYALRLIESAEVVDSVDNCQQIKTESQAREIAKALPQNRNAVIDRATEIAEERGRKTTAKVIAEAREQIEPKTSAVVRVSGPIDPNYPLTELCAMNGAGISITQIQAIPVKNPHRQAALRKVRDWIDRQLGDADASPELGRFDAFKELWEQSDMMARHAIRIFVEDHR